jgi:hypothetical protein
VTEPRDQAAAGAGHLRASHDDRDVVVEALKAAFVQGRLTQDELADRAGLALAARTYADLAALTADLPAGRGRRPAVGLPRPPAPRPPAARPRPRRRGMQAAAWGASGLVWPVVIATSQIITSPVPHLGVMSVGFLCFVAWMLVGLLIFHSWLDDRTRRRQAARRSTGPGGPAARRRRPGAARRRPPGSARPRPGAEASASRALRQGDHLPTVKVGFQKLSGHRMTETKYCTQL